MMPMDAALKQLTERVRAAAADGQPLRFRGGGTKDFYGQSLQGEVLDTRALRGIVSYEPSELVVTVGAGTSLAELEAVLAERGQMLPFEPPHFGVGATVGGMVASGLAGPARAAVGSVRDYILGVVMLNGKAEHLTFGGQVMKNVAGYDVSRLMAGSLGTLGLLVNVSLKVLPKAVAQCTLMFEMDEAQALAHLNRWGAQPLPLNASSWVIDQGRGVLYLRLRGAAAAIEAACTRLLAEHPGQRVDSAATDQDWVAARELSLPWFEDGRARGQDLWRLSVPSTAAPLNVGDTLVDWLGAQRWVHADPQDSGAVQRLREATAAAGGHATLFRAGGHNPMPDKPRFHPLSPALAKISRALKTQFDPAGIFNPGRLYPDI